MKSIKYMFLVAALVSYWPAFESVWIHPYSMGSKAQTAFLVLTLFFGGMFFWICDREKREKNDR